MTETETITETPLFRSTHAALWFAYTFDGDERKNSTLAKLQDQVEGKTYPKGRGLKGLDEYIRRLHAFYRARDGEGGLLGGRGL